MSKRKKAFVLCLLSLITLFNIYWLARKEDDVNYSENSLTKISPTKSNINVPDVLCPIRLSDADISGKEISSKRGTVNDCCKLCSETPYCKGFSWDNWDNGTCWLKDNVQVVSKIGVYVGFVSWPYMPTGNSLTTTVKVGDEICPRRFENSDIAGKEMAVKQGKLEDCCKYCSEFPGCAGYSWDYSNGGTCWLKCATKIVEKSGVFAGLVANPKKSPPDSVPFTYTDSLFQSIPKIECEKTKLLIAIFSKPNMVDERKFIRENWGNTKKYGSKIQIIFVTGQVLEELGPESNQTQHFNNYENHTYNDIMKISVVDDENGQVYKTFGLFTYTKYEFKKISRNFDFFCSTLYCKNIKCLLKADSNTTLNIAGLEKLCDASPDKESWAIGKIVEELKIDASKVICSEFPNMVYPEYINGMGYLLTGYDTIQTILSELEKSPFYNYSSYRNIPEDILFTGIFRGNGSVKIQNNGGFDPYNWTRFWCDKNSNYIKIPLIWKNFNAPQKDSWEQMQIAMKKIDFCNETNFVTNSMYATGGIGNIMYRFASTLGIARSLNRMPYMDTRSNLPATLDELKSVFPNLVEKVPILSPSSTEIQRQEFAGACCKYEDVTKLNNIPNKYLKLSGDYFQSYKFFHHARPEVRKIFEFSKPIVDSVDNFAKNLFKDDKSHILCTHIRRGDFLNDFHLETTKEFTEPAIRYAYNFLTGKNISQISLLFLGVDKVFINFLNVSGIPFQNIYKPESQSRNEDMCLAINYCDSLIMTASSSSFQFWIGYLMPDNATVFYNSQLKDNINDVNEMNDSDMFLKEWIMLTLTNNTVVHETKWYDERKQNT